jgi:hypothetical protein
LYGSIHIQVRAEFSALSVILVHRYASGADIKIWTRGPGGPTDSDCWITALRNRRLLFVTSERNLTAFRMGASIYVGTFLLGNNWDYRLAFLILVVPQLLEWTRTRSSSGAYRVMALLNLFSILASCWHFVFWYSSFLNFFDSSQEMWFVIDEFLNWILVPGLAYLLIASFPGWAKDQLHLIFNKGMQQNRAEPVIE